MTTTNQPILALAVGNTRTRFGILRGPDVSDARSLPNSDVNAIAEQASALALSAAAGSAVIASVNAPIADQLESRLDLAEVYRLGRDLPIPLAHSLDDASTLGQDRALNALAAFAKVKQACAIIDAGTAITIDFIDGQGTFQGGIIAPGLSLMLNSLHHHTHALPKLEPANPDPARGPFGKDTRHAMLLGVRNAAIGLARHTIETFAEKYEAYPQIIATGGDAQTLFANDELIEHIVPDLQLLGIAEACRLALDHESDQNAADDAD